ncbi:hypothetical protein [Corallococcus sp. CA053C]|uniref:hypothetical protein n=1 Tax=Corallococcus sp. CA053C TaxID=2316732 RepID=UPI0011C3722F|nr:hypothetical protein [Corallococcus sp. CA053C]
MPLPIPPIITLDFTQDPPTQTPSQAPRIMAPATFDVLLIVPTGWSAPVLTESSSPKFTCTQATLTNNPLPGDPKPQSNSYTVNCNLARGDTGRLTLTFKTSITTGLQDTRTAVGTIDVSGGTNED